MREKWPYIYIYGERERERERVSTENGEIDFISIRQTLDVINIKSF